MKTWQVVAIALVAALVVSFFAVRGKIPVVNQKLPAAA
jgi:uncharacterized membrane-anchored protein YhcB (DUF1043 family)